MRNATSMELLAPAGGWEQLKYAKVDGVLELLPSACRREQFH